MFIYMSLRRYRLNTVLFREGEACEMLQVAGMLNQGRVVEELRTAGEHVRPLPYGPATAIAVGRGMTMIHLNHGHGRWEPDASFKGGSEHFIEYFWNRVDTQGRDIAKMGDFDPGEEFFPSGPPGMFPFCTLPTAMLIMITGFRQEEQESQGTKRVAYPTYRNFRF